MGKPTDARVLDVEYASTRTDYRTPMKFGGRVVRDVTVLDVEMTIETRSGKTAVGRGSMTMGNAWAWPTAGMDSEATLSAMLDFAADCCQATAASDESYDPLSWAHALWERCDEAAPCVEDRSGWPESMPRLAQLVATSPLEAAFQDAFGRCCNASSFAVLGPEFVERDLGDYLSEEFRGEYLDRYVSATPTASLPLYHLVGALDPLTDGDVADRVGDSLPETLAEWIAADGLDHLKIKLAGDDLDWDVARVVAVEAVAAEVQATRQCEQWSYSLDFNERCSNVEYVLEFLRRVEAESPRALERIQYIEQPTHRDLSGPGAVPMHEAAKIKPIVIDESLVDFESLLAARELGYSGVALKACKGQAESLLMAAAASKFGLFLCVQDLTCVGASFLHSASLAAHIPSVRAIEGNGRQYCPAGNRGWDSRYPGMFDIDQGRVRTAELSGIGLGFEPIR